MPAMMEAFPGPSDEDPFDQVIIETNSPLNSSDASTIPFTSIDDAKGRQILSMYT